MLVLVVAVEGVELRRDEGLVSMHAACWRHTAKRLKYAARGARIVCLGDSLVKFGVYSRVLEEKTGRKAYNAAVTTGPAPASYVLLRRALERGARPAVVLVDFDADILKEGPRSTRRPYPWADLLTPREAAELCRVARDPDLFVRIVLNGLLHSVKNRFEIRDDIRTALRGESTVIRSFVPSLLRNWDVNAGAQVNPRGDYQEPAAPPDGQRAGTWRCDEVNRVYLERLLELADRHGAAVFWLIPPFSPVKQAYLRFLGDDERFLRFVREVQARHPGVVVVDGRYSGYGRAQFVDGVHLDRDGATAYSAALAGLVNGYLADPSGFPRWLDLPRYRPTPSGAPLEDTAQSSLALQAAAGAVRR
jgi:hypothetical protein